MAEATNKRNSVTGKVATPKPAPGPASTPATANSSAPQAMDSEVFSTALGARIQVKTIEPDSKSLEGILFTADPILNLIAINCTPAPPNPSTSLSSQPGDYHIIPVKHIASFQLLSLPEGQDDQTSGDPWSIGNENVPPVTKLDIRRMRDREEKAVQKLKDEEKKKGTGVSAEAQAIFNALDRLYAGTRWAEKSIIVMESVRLDPPYTPEDLKAPKDKAGLLPHLRKVVDGERRKIASRAQGGGTPPVGQRKGG